MLFMLLVAKDNAAPAVSIRLTAWGTAVSIPAIPCCRVQKSIASTVADLVYREVSWHTVGDTMIIVSTLISFIATSLNSPVLDVLISSWCAVSRIPASGSYIGQSRRTSCPASARGNSTLVLRIAFHEFRTSILRTKNVYMSEALMHFTKSKLRYL